MPPSSYNKTASTTAVITPSAKILQDQLHDLITRLTLASDHIKTWVVVGGDENSNKNTTTTTTTHNTTVHGESTNKLILFIQEVIKSLQKVEVTLQTNHELLRDIQVPYDLLELLDVPININPDLYVRGLMNIVIQQLIGLQRRKYTLHLLSTQIEQRLNMDDEKKRKQQKLLQQQQQQESLSLDDSGVNKDTTTTTNNNTNDKKRMLESTQSTLLVATSSSVAEVDVPIEPITDTIDDDDNNNSNNNTSRLQNDNDDEKERATKKQRTLEKEC